MNRNGWENLLCSYFYGVCIGVLSAYFTENGFSPKKDKIGGVTFRNGDIFVEISYDPEAYPNYTLSIVVGIGKEAYDEWGRFTGVPLWSVIPESSPESKLLLKTFSDENELDILLNEMKDRVLDPYAKSLWINRAKLEETMALLT